MGADTFLETYENEADLQKAFSYAVQASGWENGHGGYSGSLAEKGDVVLISNAPRSKEDAYTLAQELIDARDPRIDDKWGPAGAIGYGTIEYGPKTTRTVRVTVTVTGPHDLESEAVRKAVLATVKVKTDEKVTSITGHGLSGRIAGKDLPEPKRTYKVKATAPKAKTVTKYIVIGSKGHGAWETGFSTQAEARAWAVKAIENPRGWDASRDAEYEIVTVTRRETGEPLVKVTRELVKTVHTVDVEITHAKTLTKAPKNEHWLFFGWASS